MPTEGSGASGFPDLDTLLSRAVEELAALEPRVPAVFTFVWQGLSFSGRIDQEDKGPALILEAKIGDIPYSAENFSGRRRIYALAQSSRNGAARLRIDGGRELFLVGSATVKPPISSASVIAATTNVLVTCRDLVSSARPLCVEADIVANGPTLAV